MEHLANALQSILGKPLIDATGIAGLFAEVTELTSRSASATESDAARGADRP